MSAVEAANCAICLCEVSDCCTLSHCPHEFCFSCIQKWTELNTTCPVCREPVCWILDAAGEQHVIGKPKRQSHLLAPPEDFEEALQLQEAQPVGTRRRPAGRSRAWSLLPEDLSSSGDDDLDWLVEDSYEEEDTDYIPHPGALSEFLQQYRSENIYTVRRPRPEPRIFDLIATRHQRLWQAIPAVSGYTAPLLAAERRLPPLISASSNKRQKITTPKSHTASAPSPNPPAPAPTRRAATPPAPKRAASRPPPSTSVTPPALPVPSSSRNNNAGSSILEAMRRRGF